jgi:hypothetical protein
MISSFIFSFGLFLVGCILASFGGWYAVDHQARGIALSTLGVIVGMGAFVFWMASA